MVNRGRPAGVTLLSLFFVFGALVAGLAIVMLLYPNPAFDRIWRLNPRARAGFSAMGAWAILLMCVVCFACSTAAVGLWRKTRWGLWTALGFLALNVIGDSLNGLLSHDDRALIGLPVGALMIAYLLWRRRSFA